MHKPALLFLVAAIALPAAVDRQNVEYGNPGGHQLLLDLHIPDGPGPFAAVILVHGGGFDGGSKSTNFKPFFQPLADAGFAWFSIDYRMGPEFHVAEAVADVDSAIRWVKANANAYRIDTAKIALAGESAGGYLVNWAGTHATAATEVAGVVDFYGPADYARLAIERRDHPERFDMKNIQGHMDNGGGIRFFGVERVDDAGIARLREISPLFAVHAGMPPFLCLHGTADDQVSYEQSKIFCDALGNAGVPCSLITIDGGGHGISKWKTPEMQPWKGETIAWLRRTLKVTE